MELAGKIANVVGYRGRLATDPTKPDGAPRKLLDITKLTSLGWRPKIGLDEGLASTYQWYLDNAPRETEETIASGLPPSVASTLLREMLE